MSDETVRLLLDVDAAPVKAAVPPVRDLKVEVYDLADGVQGAAHALDTYAVTTLEAAQKARAGAVAIHEEAEAYKLAEDAFDHMVSQVVADAGRMEAATVRAGASIRGAARAAEQSVSEHSARMAMGFNQLAQGLEDLQYSVGGAMNNLGAAVAMFGGPAGLVAGATLAGIAINQLAKHWEGLSEAIGKASWDSIGRGLTDFAAHLNIVSEATDRTAEKLNAVVEAADKAREKAAAAASEQGLKAAIGLKGEADTAAGKEFVAAVGKSLRPGLTGADAVREFANLVGQAGDGDPTANYSDVQERFGRAMTGSRADLEFFRDYGRTAEKGTLARQIADAITQADRDAQEKRRQKSLSPEQKNAEEAVDKLERALNTSDEAFGDVYVRAFAKAKPSEQAAIMEASRRAPGLESRLEQEQFKAERAHEKAAWKKEAEASEKEMKEAHREAERERVEAERAQQKEDRERAEVERAQQKEDREAMREMDRQVTERNRLGRQALQAPGVRQQIERMLMQGGEPGEIAPEVGRFFEQQGLAPKGEGTFVGFGAAGQVQQDLQKRMANYTARGLDEIQAFAAVQEEILTEFVHMDQKFMHMEQSLMRQQGLMQGHRQTRLNRGEGF